MYNSFGSFYFNRDQTPFEQQSGSSFQTPLPMTHHWKLWLKMCKQGSGLVKTKYIPPSFWWEWNYSPKTFSVNSSTSSHQHWHSRRPKSQHSQKIRSSHPSLITQQSTDLGMLDMYHECSWIGHLRCLHDYVQLHYFLVILSSTNICHYAAGLYDIQLMMRVKSINKMSDAEWVYFLANSRKNTMYNDYVIISSL